MTLEWNFKFVCSFMLLLLSSFFLFAFYVFPRVFNLSLEQAKYELFTLCENSLLKMN